VNQYVSLVQPHDEVGPALYRRRPVTPAGYAFVFLLADNRLVRADQLGPFGRYRRRYDVNISDQFHSEPVTLPAHDDAFAFQGRMDIGWRVANPVALVQRGIGVGIDLVRSTMLMRMQQITRKHDVEDCAKADEEINRTLGTAPVVLPEGIEVHRFAVLLELDHKTRDYKQQLRNHGYEADLGSRRMEATRRALEGDNALLVLHLTEHKGDTSSVIDILAKDRNTSAQQRIDMFKDLLDKGVIQDIDLDELTRTLVKQSTVAVQTVPTGIPQIGESTSQTPVGQVVAGSVGTDTGTTNGGVSAWKPVGKAVP
jgi:hypothetical protein